MTHWGWYWKVKKRHIARTICSKLISIDSFKLLRQNKKNEFTVQPLEIKAKLADDHLRVTFRNRKDSAYTIPIDKKPCNYGGFRYYFKCPLCQCRMRILYFAESSIFLCRKCLNLSYKSQKLRPTERYDYMSKKIKDQIKDKGGNIDFHKKPKYMHIGTYEKIKNRQFYYERKSYQASNQELRQWHGSKIEPCLDTYFDYVDETKDWQKNKAKSNSAP